MEILQIDKANIRQIVSFIEQHQDSCSVLIGCFKGEIDEQEVDLNYLKYIIRNKSASIKTIVIDCENSRITAVTFYGSLNVSYVELLELYGDCSEQYMPYDDAYHISFKKNGDNFIKIVIYVSDKKNDNWQQQSLKNLSIHLYSSVSK